MSEDVAAALTDEDLALDDDELAALERLGAGDTSAEGDVEEEQGGERPEDFDEYGGGGLLRGGRG